MDTIKEVLRLLDGKKTLIVGVIATILAYLATKGFIGNDELVLFNGILAAIGWGASYATRKLTP